MLALADDAGLHSLAAGTSSVTSGLPSPNGASRSSSVAQARASSAEPGTIASIAVTGAGRRPRARRRRARRTPRRTPRALGGPDREPGRGAMAAEALEVLRAGAERAVQVEGRQIERPEPFQLAVVAGDQDDRAGRSARRGARRRSRSRPRASPRPRPRSRGAGASASGHASTSAIASRRIRSSTACRSRFSVSSSSASRSASAGVRRSAAARARRRAGRDGRRR